MRIDELLRDDENERYIARHSVEPEEGEQVCFGRHYAWHQGGNRYILLGQTEVGRYLWLWWTGFQALSSALLQRAT